MVRTRAENTGRRAAGAKAPRKQLGGGSSSSSVLGSPGGKDKHLGGNPVKWTQTPSWQKGIGSFFHEVEQNSSAGENSTLTGENSSSTADDTVTNGDSSTSNQTEKECSTCTEEITQAE